MAYYPNHLTASRGVPATSDKWEHTFHVGYDSRVHLPWLAIVSQAQQSRMENDQNRPKNLGGEQKRLWNHHQQ